MTPHQPTVSPRLVAVQREFAAGNRKAVETFWHDVSAQGTPLIEALPDDDAHVLVTFLWQATDEVRNVVVTGGPGGGGLCAQNTMTRLGETDIWYRTYRARADMRTTYQLAVNDSLVEAWEVDDWQERTRTWQADPLNPHTFVMPKDHLPAGAADADVILSVLELPAAPPQPWTRARPHVAKGLVADHHLHSAILGNDHALSVYTPPGETPAGAPHNLLLLFDRWAYRHFVPTATILDNLLDAGCLAPLVAILVDSPDLETRERELPCSAPFADFLVRELLPWARQRYPLTSDPARIVVGGSSYGGLAAAFAALRHPDVFGNVLSQSGAFWWKPEDDGEYEWLARQVAAGPTWPLRFYLEVGRLEAGPMAGNAPDQVVVNRHLRTVLHAKGYPVHYRDYNGGHEYVCWRATLADGLLSLLGRGASARAD